jgi:hypothetical protein
MLGLLGSDTPEPYIAGPYIVGPYIVGPYIVGPYRLGPYRLGPYRLGPCPSLCLIATRPLPGGTVGDRRRPRIGGRVALLAPLLAPAHSGAQRRAALVLRTLHSRSPAPGSSL